MAKNLNSVKFTVLLLVLVMASTEFLKSEAQCGCINPTFLDECGAVPFLGSNADCCNCCKLKFVSLACDGHVEGTEKHCHCKIKA